VSRAAERELRLWLAAAGRQLGDRALGRILNALSPGERMTMDEQWPLWTVKGQEEPGGDWRVWLMMAGRGFGKTRTGAEWVSARAREMPEARIALVGGTIEEVVKVMVKGQSGLVSVARTGEEPVWSGSKCELVWPNGSAAFAYSGGNPEKLRGPEHHFAWCDELAKWRSPSESWDNLMLGLRLGEAPRAMVTTTPRPIETLRTIIGLERTVRTSGRTADNPHLPEDYRRAMTRTYGGTRLGRQELDGHLFEDVAGALWNRDSIEAGRVKPFSPKAERSWFGRIVLAVDPPASAEGDACGIVVCGVGRDGAGYVLGDHSASGLSPHGWAMRVAAAADLWGADRVVAEANNGGNMVEAVLRGASMTLPVKLVHAKDSKCARAEPVAALFEAGQAKFAGSFPELEDQLCGMTSGGGYAGPGRSPDRADAMIWALGELLLARQAPEPRIRLL
jgi:phage terminase large subunit-like protein